MSVTRTGAITCTFKLTSGSQALFAAATATPIPHDVNAGLTTDFSMTAVVNGADTTGDEPANADVSTESITLSQTPTSLESTFVSSGAVNLAWDNPNNPTINRYEYRRAKTITNGEYDFSSWRPTSPSGPNIVTARITGLSDNTEYHIQIPAVNFQSETGVRESGPSNTVPATPQPHALNAAKPAGGDQQRAGRSVLGYPICASLAHRIRASRKPQGGQPR